LVGKSLANTLIDSPWFYDMRWVRVFDQ